MNYPSPHKISAAIADEISIKYLYVPENKQPLQRKLKSNIISEDGKLTSVGAIIGIGVAVILGIAAFKLIEKSNPGIFSSLNKKETIARKRKKK